MIHAAFCAVIPDDNVFMDVASIPPGANFRKILKDWVNQCDVLLALIGPGWIDASDPQTKGRRLDNPSDFVRIEIGEALARDIPVVPVLIDGAPLPDVGLLPDDLKELVARQAEFVEYRTFDADVERLIKKLGLDQDVDRTNSLPARRLKAEANQHADEEEGRRKADAEEAEDRHRLDEAEAEKRRQDKERSAWAAKKEMLHRWRGAAAGGAAVVALLLVGVIWLYHGPAKVIAELPEKPENRVLTDPVKTPVKTVANNLKTGQELRYLGFELENMSDDLRRRYKIKDTVEGVVVTGVDWRSRAAEKGFSPGDVIVKLGGELVESYADLDDKIQKLKQDGKKAASLYVAAPNGVYSYVGLNIQPGPD